MEELIVNQFHIEEALTDPWWQLPLATTADILNTLDTQTTTRDDWGIA